jgi:hypothetical protein
MDPGHLRLASKSTSIFECSASLISLGVRFLPEVVFGLFGFSIFRFPENDPDRFSKITETDQFRFGFLFRFFGQNRKNRWHKTADSQPVSELILYTAHEYSTHR